MAATSPTEAVQRFVESVRQGRFAESQSYLLEHVDVGASLFGSWLFNSGAAGNETATSDIFFSRKFAEVFRYAIIDAANNGDNQAFVTATRTTPHMGHLYTWALAPQRNALPYTLVGAIDSYLTKVNYPIEESQMQFTLVRELDNWYISSIHDEKFKLLRDQMASQPPLSSAPVAVPTAPAAEPVPQPVAPVATTTSVNAGRQAADAQFQATLQGLNKAPQAAAAPEEKEEKPGLFARVGRVFGIGGKQDDNLFTPPPAPAASGQAAAPVGAAAAGGAAAGANTAGTASAGVAPPAVAPPGAAPANTAQQTAGASAEATEAQLKQRFKSIRNAFAAYVASNNSVPSDVTVYDWETLRDVVNFYSKNELPVSEEQAGFRFVNYRAIGTDDYVLLVQVDNPAGGQLQVEVTPFRVDTVN
jgi:hypothetical protein